jgi:hypothetical protein
VIWVAWRQQRAETLIAVIVLALLAALFVPTGIEMASRYDHDGLSACAAATSSGGCERAIQVFTARFDSLMNLLPWLNLIPGVSGIALAAPLLLDLESGTYRLAWTQSITRRRWLAVRLGMTALAAVLAALAMTALVTWWRMPLDDLHGRFENVFDFEGTVVVGYVLFALGVSLAVGVVWRRTVPALIAGFAGYTVARVFVQNWLRQRYEAPMTITWPARSGFQTPKLDKAWILEMRPSDRLGHSINAAGRDDAVMRTGRRAEPQDRGSVMPSHESLQPRRLPPGEPVLAVPGDRDRDLRRPRRRADRVRGVVDPRADHVSRGGGPASAPRGSPRARRRPAAPRGCSRCHRAAGASPARR